MTCQIYSRSTPSNSSRPPVARSNIMHNLSETPTGLSDCKTALVRCEGCVARRALSTPALRHLPLGGPPQCSARGSGMVELGGLKRYISDGDVTRGRHVTATSAAARRQGRALCFKPLCSCCASTTDSPIVQHHCRDRL